MTSEYPMSDASFAAFWYALCATLITTKDLTWMATAFSRAVARGMILD